MTHLVATGNRVRSSTVQRLSQVAGVGLHDQCVLGVGNDPHAGSCAATGVLHVDRVPVLPGLNGSGRLGGTGHLLGPGPQVALDSGAGKHFANGIGMDNHAGPSHQPSSFRIRTKRPPIREPQGDFHSGGSDITGYSTPRTRSRSDPTMSGY